MKQKIGAFFVALPFLGIGGFALVVLGPLQTLMAVGLVAAIIGSITLGLYLTGDLA